MNSSRIEVHFPDGEVRVMPDLRAAERLAEQRADETSSEIWVVSRNDVGVGRLVSRIEHSSSRALAG